MCIRKLLIGKRHHSQSLDCVFQGCSSLASESMPRSDLMLSKALADCQVQYLEIVDRVNIPTPLEVRKEGGRLRRLPPLKGVGMRQLFI